MSLHGLSLLLSAILLGGSQCDNSENSSCNYINIIQAVNNTPGPDIRPVKNWTTPTTIQVDMLLYTVVSLDTSTQTMTTYVWFSMTWINEFISWIPDNYCGIKSVTIPGDHLWLPDLYIYELTETEDNPPVIPYYTVTYKGEIYHSKPLRIVSSCNMDTYKFPFDLQFCFLTFGPYSHGVQDVIMVSDVELSAVAENSKKIFVSMGDWSLVSISALNENITTDNIDYSQVKYQIIVKRAAVVYVINLIIPACFMILLDIASMFIDLETRERLGFKVTVVLGFSVLLLILNNMLPSSDNPPILGIFCGVCLAVMVFSIIGSVAAAYLLMLSQTHPDVPFWIQILIMKYIARVLLFKVKVCKENNLATVDTVENGTAEERNPNPGTSIEMERQDAQRDSMDVPVEVKLIKRLLAEVIKIHREFGLSNDQDEATSGWHFAAAVVDRLVLVIYLIVVIVMFAVVIDIWATGYDI